MAPSKTNATDDGIIDLTDLIEKGAVPNAATSGDAASDPTGTSMQDLNDMRDDHEVDDLLAHLDPSTEGTVNAMIPSAPTRKVNPHEELDMPGLGDMDDLLNTLDIPLEPRHPAASAVAPPPQDDSDVESAVDALLAGIESTEPKTHTPDESSSMDVQDLLDSASDNNGGISDDLEALLSGAAFTPKAEKTPPAAAPAEVDPTADLDDLLASIGMTSDESPAPTAAKPAPQSGEISLAAGPAEVDPTADLDDLLASIGMTSDESPAPKAAKPAPTAAKVPPATASAAADMTADLDDLLASVSMPTAEAPTLAVSQKSAAASASKNDDPTADIDDLLASIGMTPDSVPAAKTAAPDFDMDALFDEAAEAASPAPEAASPTAEAETPGAALSFEDEVAALADSFDVATANLPPSTAVEDAASQDAAFEEQALLDEETPTPDDISVAEDMQAQGDTTFSPASTADVTDPADAAALEPDSFEAALHGALPDLSDLADLADLADQADADPLTDVASAIDADTLADTDESSPDLDALLEASACPLPGATSTDAAHAESDMEFAAAALPDDEQEHTDAGITAPFEARFTEADTVETVAAEAVGLSVASPAALPSKGSAFAAQGDSASRLNRCEAELAELKARLNALEGSPKAAPTQLEELLRDGSPLHDRFAELIASSVRHALESPAAGVLAPMAALDERISSLSISERSNAARMDTLEKQLDMLQPRFNEQVEKAAAAAVARILREEITKLL